VTPHELCEVDQAGLTEDSLLASLIDTARCIAAMDCLASIFCWRQIMGYPTNDKKFAGFETGFENEEVLYKKHVLKT